jgi:hypothetical protein
MKKFGTMAIWHERYIFDEGDHNLDLSLYDSFSEMAKKEFGEFDVYRPIYMKEQKGLRFSTIPIGSMSGSIQIGFIFELNNVCNGKFRNRCQW